MPEAAPLTPAEIAALQAEVQELRTKVEQYELLLDNTSDLLALTTPEEEFIYLSSAIERISGYTREEYASRSLYDYIHPDDLPRIVEETARARATMPETVVIVGRVRMKSGEYRWMENRSRIIHDKNGGIKYLVMVSRDVTNHVELEQALRERTEELARANAELARAARMKDEFLAGMSHELRTPLTAILGLAEALRLSIGGTLTDAQHGMVNDIESSGRLLLDLINDLLDLAKIEAGRLPLEPSLLDVEEVCVGALRMLSEAMRAKRLKLTVQLDPEVRLLRADPRRLKQMLLNLLSNAVKFTPAGGSIGLDATGTRADGTVAITVWDTGIGIAPEDQGRLFQPFVQLETGPAREYAGTGLGLSLVQRMARMHGGDVTLASVPGEGSRFTITLPWVEEEALASAAPLPSAPAWAAGEARVLLAEDNEVLVSLLTSFLTARGYLVTVARNGQEAVALAMAQPPDAIIMDVQMPAMDGVQATAVLRACPALTSVPIIALTAHTMPGDQERCLAAGMTAYLSKPLSLELLADTLARALATRVGG